MSIAWEDSELYHCLGALELHNRVVAMGLDGTTSVSHNAASPAPDNDALSPSRGASANNTAGNFGGGGQRSTSPSVSNNNTLRSTVQFTNHRLSKMVGNDLNNSNKGGVSDNNPFRDEVDTSNTNNRSTSPPSQQPPDAMAALRKSVRNTVALATGSNNNYHKFFLRSVLWRIYLRLLPFPYTGTAREKIVEDWPTILFRCRAWYGGQRQQFLHCYPAHNYVAHECDEYEPQNGLRTFTLFAEKAAAASDPMGMGGETDSFGGGGAAGDRKSVSGFASSLRNTFRGSVMGGNGVGAMPGIAQSYTNTSCLDGGPTIIKDDIITMDIKRTYVSADHEVPHHTLYMVLAMWRWQNPLVGYQQGMHEIAGNILLMLKRACEGVPRNTPPEVAQCANLAYVEADTYMLFDAFMNELGLAELFAASSAANQQNAAGGGGGGASSAGTSRAGSPGGGSDRYSQNLDDDEYQQSHEFTTLEAVCHHIVFDLLKDHSLSLFNHFANTNVLDQLLLFLPRWIRNMFTREMTRPQVFTVWDGILAVYYADVVAAAIAEQERDAAKRAILNAANGGGGGKAGGGGIMKSFRQSMRFFKSDDGGSGSSPNDDTASNKAYSHYIDAHDGNRTLGSFSPALTEVAYVGENGLTSNSANGSFKIGGTAGGGTGGGGASGGTNPFEDDDDEDGGHLGRSVMSITSVASGRSTKRGIGRRVGGFLRTIAGVAVELLLYLEEDLLEIGDDFSQLKRLTRTPLLPPTADASGILLRATTIARTRPPGVVLKTLASSPPGTASQGSSSHSGRKNLRNTVSALTAAQNSRLTREELLEQQKSVALVIANTANRLRTIMAHHAPPIEEREGSPTHDYSSISSSGAGKKKPAAKPLTLTPEEVGQLQGVLLELEHLTDKLV